MYTFGPQGTSGSVLRAVQHLRWRLVRRRNSRSSGKWQSRKGSEKTANPESTTFVHELLAGGMAPDAIWRVDSSSNSIPRFHRCPPKGQRGTAPAGTPFRPGSILLFDGAGRRNNTFQGLYGRCHSLSAWHCGIRGRFQHGRRKPGKKRSISLPGSTVFSKPVSAAKQKKHAVFQQRRHAGRGPSRRYGSLGGITGGGPPNLHPAGVQYERRNRSSRSRGVGPRKNHLPRPGWAYRRSRFNGLWPAPTKKGARLSDRGPQARGGRRPGGIGRLVG